MKQAAIDVGQFMHDVEEFTGTPCVVPMTIDGKMYELRLALIGPLEAEPVPDAPAEEVPETIDTIIV